VCKSQKFQYFSQAIHSCALNTQLDFQNYALQVLIRCLIGFESWHKALMCLYGFLFLLLVAETLLKHVLVGRMSGIDLRVTPVALADNQCDIGYDKL